MQFGPCLWMGEAPYEATAPTRLDIVSELGSCSSLSSWRRRGARSRNPLLEAIFTLSQISPLPVQADQATPAQRSVVRRRYSILLIRIVSSLFGDAMPSTPNTCAQHRAPAMPTQALLDVLPPPPHSTPEQVSVWSVRRRRAAWNDTGETGCPHPRCHRLKHSHEGDSSRLDTPRGELPEPNSQPTKPRKICLGAPDTVCGDRTLHAGHRVRRPHAVAATASRASRDGAHDMGLRIRPAPRRNARLAPRP